jgi:hypothetical protein
MERLARLRFAVRGGVALAAALAALLPGASARAHGRSISYSSWELDGATARVVLRVAQLELTRLPFGTVAAPHLDPRLGAYLSERLVLRAGPTPCAVRDGPRALAAPAGDAVIEWRLACEGDAELAIQSELFREVAPGHLHFARIHAAGAPVLERVLSSAAPTWILRSREPGAARGGSLGDYLRLGVEHIFSGYDHLAFLLALVLIARRLREVAVIATGFTVAHSLTLALAVVGSVRPHAETVEALIGLSIAMIAAENAWWLAGRGRALPLALFAALVGAAGLAVAGIGAPTAATLIGLAIFSLAYFALLRACWPSSSCRRRA